MAGKPAEEQINNTGWGFRRYNDELVPPACTVGWEYLPNNKKVVALKKSGGSESLYSENTALTPFTTLTTAPDGAQTRMTSAFSGGGGYLTSGGGGYLTSSPTRLSCTRSVLLHSDFR